MEKLRHIFAESYAATLSFVVFHWATLSFVVSFFGL